VTGPLVRPAVAADAPALGSVHVRAWQAAYAEIMPTAYLASLRPAQRAELWAEAIDLASPGRRFLVAELDGAVAGFAASGPEEGRDDATRGQLYALNVDPQRWGRGVGSALLHETTAGLDDDGYREAVLWVIAQNAPARALYERFGWTVDGARREEDVLGVTVEEMRYRRSLAPR
jgi:ribosomal protein S18 acetylase RimI-like enzyme